MKRHHQRVSSWWTLSLLLFLSLLFLPARVVRPLQAERSTAQPSAVDVTIYAHADTFIDQGYPTSNFGNDTEIEIGFCDEFGGDGMGLISFNTAAIPRGAIIHSAELRLYKVNYSAQAANVYVHRVTSAWSESSVTWNSRPSYWATAEDVTNVGTAANNFYVWDLTDLVQQWVNESAPNHGIILNSEEGACKQFASREQAVAFRPRLVVSYTPTTPTPVPNMRSLRLDGGGDYVEIPFSDDLNNFDAITIEAWVKRDAYRCETVVGNGWTKSYWLGFCIDAIRFYHTGYQRVDGNADIPPGQWVHIAVTYDGITRRYYVNGQLDKETTQNNGPITGNPLQIALGIGGDYDGGYYFKGLIDEVRIWNVVRTEEEIKQYMYEVIDGPKPGLVAVWHFDGDVTDAANNHHGALRGDAWFSPEGFPNAPTSTPTPPTPTPSPTPTVALGSIGGIVWHDQNYNGVPDPGEEGIPNIRIELRQGSIVRDSLSTGADGRYRFDGLPSGTYVVDVDYTTLPWYYEWSTGNDPETVILGAGEHRDDVNFGYARQPRVWAYVEVNQAIQNAIFSAPAPPQQRLEVSPVPILPNKTTVVRYYLLANWPTNIQTTSGVALRLDVLSSEGGGSTHWIQPNTGQSSVAVPEAPADTTARDNLIREMRADLSRTLNFVISADQIPENTFRIRLTLEGLTLGDVDMGRTGSTMLDLASPRVLGLSIVRMNFLDAPPEWSPAPGITEIKDNVLPYLKAAYPISGIRARWLPTVHVSLNRWLRALGGDPDRVAGEIWATYRETLPIPGATWSTIFVSARFPGGDGKGYPCGAAFAAPNGNVSAQEIGHGLNFGHINSVHNPGDREPDTYGHAAIGEFNISTDPHQTQPPPWGNIGVAAKQEEDGSWDVVLVNPGDPDSDDHAHEFMSYGPPRVGTPLARIFTLQYANGEWISDVMYNRFYKRMNEYAPLGCGSTSGMVLASAPKAAQRNHAERVKALIFTASADENGQFKELSLTSAFVSEGWLNTDAQLTGPYVLELLDKQGKILVSRSFDLTKAPGSTQGGGQVAALAIPYVSGIDRIAVRKAGQVVAERKASPNAPDVRVISPNGGEKFSSGLLTIRWEVSDLDGDPVDLLVEYSPDGGNSWLPLGFVSGDKGEIEVNIDELEPGQKGVIRVAASDGVNTAQDQSDGFFSVSGFTTYLPIVQR